MDREAKRLTIIYDNAVLFDGGVEELGWQDAAHQVSVVGKLKRQPTSASPGVGFLDLLTGARRERTSEVVKAHKQALAAEAEEALAADEAEEATVE